MDRDCHRDPGRNRRLEIYRLADATAAAAEQDRNPSARAHAVTPI
jgi:hypothetical protein